MINFNINQLTTALRNILLLSLVSSLAIAQEVATTVTPATDDKAVVNLGPFELTPTLRINVTNDDNIFLESSNETSSTLTRVQPSFSAVADDGVFTYTLEYQLENGTYTDNSSNNYTDHDLEAEVDWRISVRHLLELSTSLEKGHQDRSTDNVTALNVTELNEFTQKEVATNYTLGSEGARGRVQIGFQTQSLRYDTNLLTTSVLESDIDTATASFTLALTPSVRTSLQVTQTDNEFINNAIENREDLNVQLGVEWDFTGTTKGNIRLGRADNDLVNALGDTSQSTGQASIEWSPQDYSVWTLTADKSASNSENDVGAFIDRTELSLSWAHTWSDNLNMEISATQQTDDFVGDNRSDDTNTFQVGFAYTLRRWLNIGLTIAQENRDSSDTFFDYDKNTVTLTINASL